MASGIRHFAEQLLPAFFGTRQCGTPQTRSAPATRPDALPHYHGHRQRLRTRFMQDEGESMPDYEILELILLRAVPKRDMKPLAKRLISEFGSFSDVLAAPASRLLAVPGVGPACLSEIKIVAAAARRLSRSVVIEREVISSWDALIAYCRTRLAHRTREEFRVLFLDRRNRLIADEALGQGTVNHVPVYPREVLRRAIELESSALILLHNHPTGDPSPSQDDIAMTATIADLVRACDIALHDHVIIAKAGEFSFRANGLLQ